MKRRALGRTIGYRIVGGPRRGRTIFLNPVAALLPLVRIPRTIRGDDGKVQVIGFDTYALEPETLRAIYQIEESA